MHGQGRSVRTVSFSNQDPSFSGHPLVKILFLRGEYFPQNKGGMPQKLTPWKIVVGKLLEEKSAVGICRRTYRLPQGCDPVEVH